MKNCFFFPFCQLIHPFVAHNLLAVDLTAFPVGRGHSRTDRFLDLFEVKKRAGYCLGGSIFVFLFVFCRYLIFSSDHLRYCSKSIAWAVSQLVLIG